MSLSPLIPLAAASLVPLAERAVDRVADGISFLRILGRQGANQRDGARGPEAARDGEEAAQSAPATTAAAALHMQQLAEQQLDDFLAAFQGALADRGIAMDGPIELKSDGRQGAILTNDHPRRADIEQLLDERPDLTRTFHQAAAMLHAAQGGERPSAGRHEIALRIAGGRVQVLPA